MHSSSLASQFPGEDRTQWSIVAAAGLKAEERQDALKRLAAHYFYPVFAYLVDQGRGFDDAFAHAHAFFAERCLKLDPKELDQGFREFLLRELDRYAPQSLSAGFAIEDAAPLRLLKQRYEREQLAPAHLSERFKERYAREVLSRALSRLKREAIRNGKAPLFDALAPFLTAEPSTAQADSLREALGMSPLSFSVALKRLRARFRELSTDELTQTVLGGAQIANERTVLHTLIKRDP